MSIKEIRHFGDPVLVTPANLVIDFDKELRTLVKDLTETMLDVISIHWLLKADNSLVGAF